MDDPNVLRAGEPAVGSVRRCVRLLSNQFRLGHRVEARRRLDQAHEAMQTRLREQGSALDWQTRAVWKVLRAEAGSLLKSRD
jgi:hypothetical protein